MGHAPAGVILIVLALASAAEAQPAKDLRTVKRSGTEVRADAGEQPTSYVTNRLRQGDVVEVVEVRPDGWLQVRPPAGSTSWISHVFLGEIVPGKPNKVVAMEEGTPVFPSPAEATAKRPRAIGARLKLGHQVIGTGNRQTDRDGIWVEIESPDTEARYVRADAVGPAAAGDVVPTGGSFGGNNGSLTRSAAPSANMMSPAEDLRRQAVQADLSGNAAEAVRLYDRIIAKFGATHPRLAKDCQARADYLRSDYHREAVADSINAARAGAPVRRQAAVTSTSTVRERDRGDASSFVNATPTRLDTKDYRAYRGRLSRAHSQVDGERAYLLQLTQPAGWLVFVYVVGAGPGVNLESVVGRTVEVRGPVTPHGRAHVMRAVQVAADD